MAIQPAVPEKSEEDHMADNKNLVGSIMNKAKNIAENSAVADAVEKAKKSAKSSGIQTVLEKGTQRAKSIGSATKLSIDLNRDYRQLDRLFREIGKLYYEQSAEAPEGPYVPLFEQVASMRGTIRSKEAEMKAYKTASDTAHSDGQKKSDQELNGRIDDFESVVDQTESDGCSL